MADGEQAEQTLDEAVKVDREELEVGGEDHGAVEENIGDQGEGEHLEGEHVEGEHVEGEHEQFDSNEAPRKRKKRRKEFVGEGEEQIGEEFEVEGGEEEQTEAEEEEKQKEKEEEQKPKEEEKVEEEEAYVEEPPPDPAAPYNLSDSKEALKAPFELRPEQIAEVEQLWDYYQNYTPAYSDIDGYITEKELIYLLKCLLLMTYTPEQLQELIDYCVRPPHPDGHISFDQFLKMVTLRQREFQAEDELRSALQVFDPEKTGSVDRENLKEVLLKQGYKMPEKQLNSLIKEVDISNDGTIGVEDVVGTMCIDLNKDDIMMMRATLNPETNVPPPEED